jgi:hypothetical protein
LSGWLLNQLDSPSFAWRTKALLFTVGVYEERSCVSIEFLPHFYHKIWGAVSVMMEGVYRVGQSSG